MIFEWDEAKDEKNRLKHGVGFDAARDFRWEEAVVFADDRRDYGECRQRAFGRIGDKIYVVVFTARGGSTRIISLRRANKREEKLYETFKTS